jgi:purine-nucleoside phosphorylase
MNDHGNASDPYTRTRETVDFLQDHIDQTPDAALVLGSGLGALADELDDPYVVDYADIPHFPVSSVEGHAGELCFGDLEDSRVVIMSGRAHYYEGWSPQQLTFPVRTFGQMGIDRLLVTNSAGGAHPDFRPGNLMLITDHINMMGMNPLRGPNDERLGPRFPDMTHAYDPETCQLIRQVAGELDIDLKEGVYAGVSGPSYETPAEINMIQTIGGDAVGMSTVPEVIVANHQNMKVGGISCITNFAAGLSDDELDHSEVKEVASRIRETFSDLIRGVVSRL